MSIRMKQSNEFDPLRNLTLRLNFKELKKNLHTYVAYLLNWTYLPNPTYLLTCLPKYWF